MYAENESDCLLFQQKDEKEGGGLELVETPLAVQHMDKVLYSMETSFIRYLGQVVSVSGGAMEVRLFP